ncbi:MAG: hypothetical protein HQK79_13180 [Desulfobacterales bacterium]|nr:hypothetical protein [Desulfobacterales bacterium]
MYLKYRIMIVILIGIFLSNSFQKNCEAAEDNSVSKTFKKINTYSKENLKPELKKGKKYRIGILESGVWGGFILYFKAWAKGLTAFGWGNKEILEGLTKEEQADIKIMINALNKKKWSEYIEFSEDAYRKMTLETRKNDTDAVAKISNLDIIIGLGTWAGQDLRALPESFKTPCLISAVSMPIESKIIDSVNDSGRDNIFGRVEPDRFKNQIQLFHDVIGFKRLGVVYSGIDPTAYQYAAIPDIEAVKQKRGFELIAATSVPPSGDIEKINQKFIENLKKLVEIDNIDAFYLTLQNGINQNTLPKIIEIFNKYKIPTFAMGGPDYVKKGILLSVATNWDPIGVFEAQNTIKILKGNKPRDLNLIFEAEPRIAINLETAKIIGYDPPVDILGASDEIYTNIER